VLIHVHLEALAVAPVLPVGNRVAHPVEKRPAPHVQIADKHSGQNIRVEHWVLAERQGQTAARNMLGQREAFDDVPFFWSQHYDVPINYVGHAEKWDDIAIDGDIGARDCLVRYKLGGRVLAVASIYRDVASLEAEIAMEKAAV